MSVQTVGVNLIPDDSPINVAFETVTNEGIWKRAGIIFVGGILILIGVVLLIAGSRAVKNVTKLATGVVTKGIVK